MMPRDPRHASAMSLDTNEPPATPIRQPAYAQLNLSSTDRYPNFTQQFNAPISSSSYTLQRPNYLLNGYFTRLGISQVQFQYNLPTIVATSSSQPGNDQFVIVYPGAGYTSLSQSIVQVIVPGGTQITMTMSTSLGAGAFTVGQEVEVVGTVTTTAAFQGTVSSWTAATGLLVLTPILDVQGFDPNPAAQTWKVSNAASSFLITITQGFYTTTTLAAAIQAAVRTAVGNVTFNCAYGGAGNPNGFTFSDATAFNFGFPGSSIIAGNFTRFFNTIGGTRAMFAPPATTIYSGIPTMRFTRWIDICSSGLTQFQRVKDATTLPIDTYTTTVARMYLTPPTTSPVQTSALAGVPYTWTVDFANIKYIKWDVRQVLSNFDLQLRDEYGSLLWWSPQFGCEYQFTLLASES